MTALAPAIVARKGSHVRLVDGTFMPSRSYPKLTGVWGKQRQDDNSERASIPSRPAHRNAESGCAASPFLTLDDAASRLHKSRRWLQDWLRDHPADRNGEPYYAPLGRTKTFEERDIQRIRDTMREELQCRLKSSRREKAGRRTIGSGAPISESTLTEALRL